MSEYDILLDPATNDLPIRPELSRGIQVIGQRIKERLSLSLGEWFLDGSQGLPWSDWFQTKPVPLDAIQTLTRAEVESTPGVVAVQSWEAVWNERTRTVTITGYVRTEDGDIDATFRAELAARGTADWRYTLLIAPVRGIVR